MEELLRLPLKIATFPLIAMLLVLQLIASIIVGLTSVVTNLLATIFLISSVAGWATNAPIGMVAQIATTGILFSFAPHIASWLPEKVTDLAPVIMAFLLS